MKLWDHIKYVYIRNVNKFVRNFWKVDFRGQNKYKVVQKY